MWGCSEGGGWVGVVRKEEEEDDEGNTGRRHGWGQKAVCVGGQGTAEGR